MCSVSQNSSRFESLILSHNSRFTCEFNKEDINDDDDDLSQNGHCVVKLIEERKDYDGVSNKRDIEGQIIERQTIERQSNNRKTKNKKTLGVPSSSLRER